MGQRGTLKRNQNHVKLIENENRTSKCCSKLSSTERKIHNGKNIQWERRKSLKLIVYTLIAEPRKNRINLRLAEERRYYTSRSWGQVVAQ